jgi:hypothetical protein
MVLVISFVALLRSSSIIAVDLDLVQCERRRMARYVPRRFPDEMRGEL